MSVFLLKQPDAVFIHVPKTAGRSVRVGAWEGRYEGPVRGSLPEEWLPYFKFCFVRHPIDRMISGWRMFSEGRFNVPIRDHHRLLAMIGIKREVTRYEDHAPLFPGLSLSDFLNFAADESIPLNDRTPGLKKRRSVLRNHAIPQSHPFNLVGHADYVGRFENLTEEMQSIGQRLGRPIVLPDTNKTRPSGSWRQHFTPDLYDRAVDYYREDFERFGYDIQPLKAV